MSDPWVIQPHEHAKFAEHFRSLNPVNGMVTGEQAKRFMLQSQLPPPILGQIWFLSDTNADGKLDLKEFSIACKMINLKLHGVEIPKALPPSLVASLTPSGIPKPILPPAKVSQPVTPATPPLIPGSTSNQSLLSDLMGPPLIPSTQVQPMKSVGATPPLIPTPPGQTQPLISAAQPLIGQSQPLMGGAQPLIGGGQPLIGAGPPLIGGGQPLMGASQPLIGARQPLMGSGQPMIGAGQPLIAQVQPMTGVMQPLMSASVPSSAAQPLIAAQGPLSTPQQPSSIPQIPPPVSQMTPSVPPLLPPPSSQGISSPPKPVSESVATSTPLASSTAVPRRPSLDSEALKPGILSPSQDVPLGSATSPPTQEWAIPQPHRIKYTQLFNATDRAKTGSVSGHQARSIMLQSRLPQQTLAQIWALADVDSDGKLGCEEFILAMYLCEIATHGETIPTKLPQELIPPSFRRDSVSSTSSYEERRRENFVRGQAELERRRSILAETQAKEKAERERKEREEAEKREKARLEVLRKEQEELERKKKEEDDKREAARREMERQCQLEWEMKRTRELEAMRAEEQSKVLALKAKSQNLAGELGNVNSKAANLAKDIRETRTNVATVKATIDGMRTSRDTSMSEMSTLKAKVKELNQKQIELNKEKANLDAKLKSSDGDEGKLNILELHLKQLKDKVEAAKLIVETKSKDLETNKELLAELNLRVSELSSKCDRVWAAYEQQRRVYEERCTAPAAEAWSSTQEQAWDTAGGDVWPETDGWPAQQTVEAVSNVTLPAGGVTSDTPRYRCVFEFCSRGADELSLQPGDLISDASAPHTTNEPGWRWGSCRGQTGWYPESYVEEIGAGQTVALPVEDIDTNKTQLEEISEIPEIVNDFRAGDMSVAPIETKDLASPEMWVAAYPYSSGEPGDLIFDAGDAIQVVSKDGDWWTGKIGTRVGVFPSNYVLKADPSATPAVAATPIQVEPQMQQSDSKIHTPICSEIASITEAAQAAVGATSARPSSATGRRDSGRDSVTGGRRNKEVAQALANYTASSAEQLSLTKGQLLIVRKKADSGWWEGELQAKGRGKQIGWFPASYVKLLQSSGRMSGRTTPVSKTDPSEIVIDKVIALYPYTAQNADELSFEKDDIISVLDREQDPAWWQGELRGMTGLFPSNYVTKLVHDN